MHLTTIASGTLAALVLTLAVTPVFAASPRTFVSGKGVDSGSCAITAPCRSFSYAVTQTAAGGELAVLDTAGYGPVTITQSISIQNQQGVEAGITTMSATDGVTISAGANDVVNLTGLTLTGGGVGNSGITFQSGGNLNIENCVVQGFQYDGIGLFQGASKTTISDTIVSNVGQHGIDFAPGAAASLTVQRSQLIRNASAGLFVGGGASSGTVQASLSDSLLAGNKE